MPASVMLDDIVLPLVQDIRMREDQGLVAHRVPGLDGAAYQHLGRLPAVVVVVGMFADDDSLAALTQLRERFQAHEPLPFSADITTATEVQEVIIDDLHVSELAGRPQQFRYVLRLLEFVPPPPPETPVAELSADSFLDGIGDVFGLPSLDLTDPLPPLRGLLEPVTSAAGALTEALGPLDELLGT